MHRRNRRRRREAVIEPRFDHYRRQSSRRDQGAYHHRAAWTAFDPLQPNHPRDDPDAIAASIYEGLAYGSGDALIGINPCIDEPANLKRLLDLTAEIIDRTGAPTQNCLLGHVTTQMRALEIGAPIDILFQSLAGTEKACGRFGINVAMLDEAYRAIRERGALDAPNLMYFETGQGSELSATRTWAPTRSRSRRDATASRAATRHSWSTRSSVSSDRNIFSMRNRSRAPASRIT